MNFLPINIKRERETIDRDGERALDDWIGIKGKKGKVITPMSIQEDRTPYQEFIINTKDPKFIALRKNQRLFQGDGHFNPDLKIIYVYPKYLSNKDENGDSEIIRPREIPLLRRSITMSSPPRKATKRTWPTELLPTNTENYRKSKSRKLFGGFHLFKRLGVTRRANTKQIKRAYEKMKKKRKGKLSKKVKLAYKILSNPKSRKKYINSYKHKKTKKRRKRNQRGCSRRRK